MNRQFVIEGLLLTAIGSIGILGNIGAIFHFGTSKYRQHRFYSLMLALAVVDTLVIISFIWFSSVPEFLGTKKHIHYWSIWLYPMLHIFCTGNIFLTAAISHDRYLAICKPLSYHISPRPIKVTLMAIFVASILYNIPIFFELEWKGTIKDERNGSEIIYEFGAWPTELRIDYLYVEIYVLWCNMTIQGIIPVLILIGLNISIVKEMRRFRQYVMGTDKDDEHWRKNQLKFANINLVIVIVFIVCYSFRNILSAYELYYRYTIGISIAKWPHKTMFYMLSEISHLMVVLNSCISFYVYLFKRFLNDKVSYIQDDDTLNIEMS